MSVFDPVLYSSAELSFLSAHLGEPILVAMQNVPAGVNPKAVRPILEEVRGLVELESHSGNTWAGLGALKDAIALYQEQATKWSKDKRRGAPRFPSLYAFDSKNRPHRGGPGSDSLQVKSFINPSGDRVPFAVELHPDTGADYQPDWTQAVDEKPQTKGIARNDAENRIECLVCGHTESFRPDSRGSYNAARGRISKHLRTSVVSPEIHREVHTLEFGAPSNS